MNMTVQGWSSDSTVCLTPMLFPKVLNAKQGKSMYYFSNLWHGLTMYQTLLYCLQSEHPTTGPWTWFVLQFIHKLYYSSCEMPSCVGGLLRLHKDVNMRKLLNKPVAVMFQPSRVHLNSQ